MADNDDTRDDDATRDNQDDTDRDTDRDTGKQGDTDDAAQRDGDADKPDDGDTTDWKAQSRKWERQAKANAAKAKKLDDIEAANKTEAEKLATARDEALKKAQAATDRAVEAEVKSVARDLKFRDPADALRLVDLSELADDDGEVDDAAVTKALKKIARDKPYLISSGTGGPSGGDFAGGTGSKGGDTSSMSVDDFRKARKRA